MRTGADRYGQLWFLDFPLSWRTFGGQVRIGSDNSGSWVSFLLGGHLAERCGQVRTGTDNSGSWVSLIIDENLEDRCGQVRTTLVPGCHSLLTDIRRTCADRWGQVQTSLVPKVSPLGGGHLADSWISGGLLYHF